jgi:hypothetical protein
VNLDAPLFIEAVADRGTVTGLDQLMTECGFVSIVASELSWSFDITPEDLWRPVTAGIAVIGATYQAQSRDEVPALSIGAVLGEYNPKIIASGTVIRGVMRDIKRASTERIPATNSLVCAPAGFRRKTPT